jgi:hypothetical protein
MQSTGSSKAAIALGVVGGILILIFIVKVTIIGYYQSEIVTYLVMASSESPSSRSP